jgi:hypothetical protein
MNYQKGLGAKTNWLVLNHQLESNTDADSKNRHLDTCYLSFPLSLRKCWDYSLFPSYYCMFLMQPSRLQFIKIKLSCSESHWNHFSKLNTDTNSKIKISWPVSQDVAYNHPNVFSSILLLSEGRPGESGECSNKLYCFSFPTLKCLSLFPGLFTYYTLCLSLSLSLSLFLMVIRPVRSKIWPGVPWDLEPRIFAG